MGESNRHHSYKQRLKYALVKTGEWEEACNEAVRSVSTQGLHQEHKTFDYRLDVFARRKRDGLQLGIEVNNPRSGGGHLTPRATKKDEARRKAIFNQHSILVLKLEFYQLAGLQDFNKEVIEEIDHEIKRWEKTSKVTQG